MRPKPSYVCPSCGQLLEYRHSNNKGIYRCNNEGCHIHYVMYDRRGNIVKIAKAAKAIKQYVLHHGKRDCI